MSSEGARSLALAVRGLGKSYEITRGAGQRTGGPSTLGETLLHRLRHAFQSTGGGKETFWALQDVSFELYSGDVVGVVGRNGAGKSTLLKLLSRITEPTTGRIELYGRVGSLLEVGTGFHPELTGRENIYLNGAVLGMSRAEISRQFDAIVEFAEVERFLETPVKRYSSGMYVRLAFAVAAHLNPEILIVDEVLAVGDATFQRKCLGKMQDVARDSGRTVLFVSHNMAAIRSLCSRALLLEHGSLTLDGSPDAVIARYSAQTDAAPNRVRWRQEDSSAPDFWFVGARALPDDGNGEEAMALSCSDSFTLEVEYVIRGTEPLANLQIGFQVQTEEGILALSSHDPRWAEGTSLEPGRYISRCVFPAYCLNEGRFQARFHADIPHERRLQITGYDLPLVFEDREGHGVNAEKLPGILRPRLVWAEARLDSFVPADVVIEDPLAVKGRH